MNQNKIIFTNMSRGERQTKYYIMSRFGLDVNSEKGYELFNYYYPMMFEFVKDYINKYGTNILIYDDFDIYVEKCLRRMKIEKIKNKIKNI
jgi:hypothetical protein